MGRLRLVTLAFLLLYGVHLEAGSFAENYGIGTVHVVPYNFFSLAFYSNKGDVAPFDQVDFTEDKKQGTLHFRFATAGNDTTPSWFMPMYFGTEPEKRRLDMYCIERDGEWCKVIVNILNHKTKWVHLGADVQYQDWNTFFTSVASVEIDVGDPFLFDKPSKSSKHKVIKTGIEAGGTQIIQAKKVEGEWMQVEVTTFTFNMEITGRQSGWIKWHDENMIFIDFNLSLD